MTDQIDAKRQEIKDRIAASQQRNQSRGEVTLTSQIGQKAGEAKDGITAFAKQHPVATVAGGVAVGVLISAMFRNSPTRKLGRAAGAKTAGWATIGSQVAIALGQHAIDASYEARRASAEKLEDVGDAIGDTSRKIRREASYRVSGASDTTRKAARGLGKSISRTIGR